MWMSLNNMKRNGESVSADYVASTKYWEHFKKTIKEDYSEQLVFNLDETGLFWLPWHYTRRMRTRSVEAPQTDECMWDSCGNKEQNFFMQNLLNKYHHWGIMQLCLYLMSEILTMQRCKVTVR
jgi:hypothetical protein